MEKEEHRIPEGNPVTQECFSVCAPMEKHCKGPKTKLHIQPPEGSCILL